MTANQVIDVLAAVARELLDLDARTGTSPIEAIGAAMDADEAGRSPYLETILAYARDAWLVCACGESTADELYVLTEEAWEEAYPDGGPRAHNPCVSCLEDALERDLEPDDFADDPLNSDPELLRSPRLKERMGLPG